MSPIPPWPHPHLQHQCIQGYPPNLRDGIGGEGLVVRFGIEAEADARACAACSAFPLLGTGLTDPELLQPLQFGLGVVAHLLHLPWAGRKGAGRKSILCNSHTGLHTSGPLPSPSFSDTLTESLSPLTLSNSSFWAKPPHFVNIIFCLLILKSFHLLPQGSVYPLVQSGDKYYEAPITWQALYSALRIQLQTKQSPWPQGAEQTPCSPILKPTCFHIVLSLMYLKIKGMSMFNGQHFKNALMGSSLVA